MVLFQKERTLNTIIVFFKRFKNTLKEALLPEFKTPLEALFTIERLLLIHIDQSIGALNSETYGILMNEIDPFFRHVEAS